MAPSSQKHESRQSRIRIYLDESGKFEGQSTSLVCGPVVFEGGPDIATLSRVLLTALEQWPGPLPPNGRGQPEVHGYGMRKQNTDAYRAVITTLLEQLEKYHARKQLFVLAIYDRAQTFLEDRNIAHAAVVARGLAQAILDLGCSTPVYVEVAGRASDRGRITDTQMSLPTIIKARIAEEFALTKGAEAPPELTPEVRHLDGTAWEDPKEAPLLIADLLSNLLYSGQKAFPELHSRLRALFLNGKSYTINENEGGNRGAEILRQHGEAVYLSSWVWGALGQGRSPAEKREEELRAEEAFSAIKQDPKKRRQLLDVLHSAVHRQVQADRRLTTGEVLAKRLLELADAERKSGERARGERYGYRALLSLLDVANHRGDVSKAKPLLEKERGFRSLSNLVESFEFRNRVAEMYINAYDFAQAEELLQTLLAEVARLRAAVDDSGKFPTEGRILSHLGQVHHHQGKYGEAQPLYARALAQYTEAIDTNITSHHLARALIGAGDFDSARTLLRELGVADDLTDFVDPIGFLTDLVALFARECSQRGVTEYQTLQRTVLEHSDIFLKVDGAKEPYPAATTLMNFARLAANAGAFDQARDASQRSLWLVQGSFQPTLLSIAFAAAIEALEHEHNSPEPGGDYIESFLSALADVAPRLVSNDAPPTLVARFQDAQAAIKRWQTNPRVPPPLEELRAFAHRVPFGSARAAI